MQSDFDRLLFFEHARKTVEATYAKNPQDADVRIISFSLNLLFLSEIVYSHAYRSVWFMRSPRKINGKSKSDSVIGWDWNACFEIPSLFYFSAWFLGNQTLDLFDNESFNLLFFFFSLSELDEVGRSAAWVISVPERARFKEDDSRYGSLFLIMKFWGKRGVKIVRTLVSMAQ